MVDETKNNVVDLRAAVEARRTEEAEKLGGQPPGGDDLQGTGGPDDPKFVRACLESNERGDGILFATLHRGRFVYVKSRDEKSKAWFRWAGHHWDIDKGDFHHAAVEDVAMIYQREAMRLKDPIVVAREELTEANTRVAAANKLAKELKTRGTPEEIAACNAEGREADEAAQVAKVKLGKLTRLQKDYYDRVDRLRSLRGAKNCLEFAHKIGDDGLFIYGDEVDKKPMLLPCANGVIDLETGELLAGNPDDMLVRAIPVAYRGIDTPAPVWETVIDEIHRADRKLVDFIHRFFGYCMVGIDPEQVYACFIGEGANGKGTMFEVIREILGDLSWSINSELLLDSKIAKSPDGPSPAIMSLQGRRLVVASETDEGRKISGKQIKMLTGSDTLTGRNLFDKFDTNFRPTHKLVLYTNHAPRGLASDFALKRRLLYITYDLRYVDDPEYHARQEPLQAELFRKKDPKLKAKLLAEKEGILAWLVRGCLLWQRDGLCIPDSIRANVEEVMRKEDYVQQFLDAICTGKEKNGDPLPPGHGVTFKALYERYAKWYRDEIGNDEKDKRFLLSKRRFGEQLRRKGYHLPDPASSSGRQGVVGVTFDGVDYEGVFVCQA